MHKYEIIKYRILKKMLLCYETKRCYLKEDFSFLINFSKIEESF